MWILVYAKTRPWFPGCPCDKPCSSPHHAFTPCNHCGWLFIYQHRSHFLWDDHLLLHIRSPSRFEPITLHFHHLISTIHTVRFFLLLMFCRGLLVSCVKVRIRCFPLTFSSLFSNSDHSAYCTFHGNGHFQQDQSHFVSKNPIIRWRCTMFPHIILPIKSSSWSSSNLHAWHWFHWSRLLSLRSIGKHFVIWNSDCHKEALEDCRRSRLCQRGRHDAKVSGE